VDWEACLAVIPMGEVKWKVSRDMMGGGICTTQTRGRKGGYRLFLLQEV
jgi:hypothetical protein